MQCSRVFLQHLETFFSSAIPIPAFVFLLGGCCRFAPSGEQMFVEFIIWGGSLIFSSFLMLSCIVLQVMPFDLVCCNIQ